MPCLCPQSAPSYTALWVTDDILAAAWRRFTHIYNSPHGQLHRIDGGRRHGSNVPGPLEFRRRLARRRMGLASYQQPPNGGGADFGALFGFGTRSADRQDVEKGWSWQAPRSQQADTVVGPKEKSAWRYGWPGGKPKRKAQEQEQDAWERLLDLPGDKDAVEGGGLNSGKIGNVPVDPVVVSRNAFGDLLAKLDSYEPLSAENLADVVTFLQSSADEFDAKNTSRLLTWLGTTRLEAREIRDLVVDMIVNKIHLGTLPMDECAHALKMLTRALQSASPDFNSTHHLLRALSVKDMLVKTCATTTRLMVDESPDHSQLAPIIDMWLSCLHHFEENEGSISFDVVWLGVYEQLSLKDPRLQVAVLHKHLSAHDPVFLTDILMHCWVPHFITAAVEARDRRRREKRSLGPGPPTHTMLLSTLWKTDPSPRKNQYSPYSPLGIKARNRRHRGKRSLDPDLPAHTMLLSTPWKIDPSPRKNNYSPYSPLVIKARNRRHREKSSLDPDLPTHTMLLSTPWKTDPSLRKDLLCPYYPLVDLIGHLAKHRIPYETLARRIFAILSFRSLPKSDKHLFRAYLRLWRHSDLRPTAWLGEELIHHFVARKALHYALYVFRSIPKLSLSRVHDLPIAIADDSSKISSSAIWFVLNRVTQTDRTPRPRLGSARQPLILPPTHIDLVHRVAFAFAKQEQLRPRVAFRRVWECYRFLKDRSAPVESLISRAMVTAGVIRPLKMRRRIPTQVLRYTLQAVASVEGQDVANQLDQKVLEIWERAVLPEILKAKRSGDEEVPIAQKADRWRTIVWARRRRGRNKGVYPRPSIELEEHKVMEGSYKPFVFGDAKGDVSMSSPRAGADFEAATGLSTARKDYPDDLALPNDEIVVGQEAALIPSRDEEVGALLQPAVATVRRGLGYSTHTLGTHDDSGAKAMKLSSGRLIGELPAACILNKSPDTTPSPSSMASERYYKRKERVASLEYSHGLGEHLDTPPQSNFGTQPNRDGLSTVAELSEQAKGKDQCPSPSPAMTIADPFPIWWRGKPRQMKEANFIFRRLSKEHSRRGPTESEMAFMQSYHAALDPVFDNGRPITGQPAYEFPLQWGDIMISKDLCFSVRKYVTGRAETSGRELDERERLFVKTVNRARVALIAKRREEGKAGVDDAGKLPPPT